MKDFNKEVEEIFEKMSNDEFDKLLLSAGFKVEEGHGEIIVKEESAHTIKQTIRSTYKVEQNTFVSNVDNKISTFSFLTAC